MTAERLTVADETWRGKLWASSFAELDRVPRAADGAKDWLAIAGVFARRARRNGWSDSNIDAFWRALRVVHRGARDEARLRQAQDAKRVIP
jgi:hypothetical protein